MIHKRISYIGIIMCILYFFSVGLFLVTKTEIALTVWELLTILGAPMTLLVLLALAKLLDISAANEKVMLAFMACTCSLTGLAHIVNITVTRPLIADGMDIPDYLKVCILSNLMNRICRY